MAEKLTVQTSSENTIKAYEALKENGGELSYTELAQELGFEKHSKILGGVNSLRKKGAILDGEEKEISDEKGTRPVKTIKVNPDIEVVFEKVTSNTGISEKGIALLKFFQDQGTETDFTAQEVAEQTDLAPIAVHAVAKRLVKEGLVEKSTIVTTVGEGENEAEKELKVFKLTEEGAAYQA